MHSQIYEISFLSTLSIMHMLEPGHYSTAQCVRPSAVTSPSAQQCTTIGTTLAQPASVVDATMARVEGRAPRRHGRRWRVQRWRGRHWRGRRRRGRRWRGQRWTATATAPLLLPLPLAPLLLPLLLLQLRMLSAQASKVRGGQNHHTAAINARCRRVPPALGPATIRRVRSTRWSRLGVRSMRWSRPCKALLAKSPPTSLPPMPSQPVSTTPPSPTPPAAAAPPK